MKKKTLVSLLLTLALLFCASAAPAEGTPDALMQEALQEGIPDWLPGEWTIRDLHYEAAGLNGLFTIKGDFKSTYELTLGADGTMKSTLALDTMHKIGVLAFAFPEFELSVCTEYTWENGKLVFLPAGTAMDCVYDEENGTVALSYSGTVTVDKKQNSVSGGESSLILTMTLTKGGEETENPAPEGAAET